MSKAATKAALKRRLSPAARAAMSTAGLASLPMLMEARRTSASVKKISAEYEQQLLATFGDTPTPIQRGQVLACVATYTALQITLNKLRTARPYKTLAELIIQLNPLVSSLQRSLRVLGVSSPADADVNAQPRGGLQEYLANKAKQAEVADDAS